jgi:hypothetical protein
MGIYFGNLDRELADRQRVIQEDTERQYRGGRDTLKAFSDLGSTISTEVKEYKERGREDERIKYNIRRNTESDRIRGEQHKINTLDSKIKNIMRLEKRSVDSHVAKQWNYQDPELVTKHYERIRKEEGADDTLDPALRIMKYQGLYGAEAVKSARNLLWLEKNDGSEKDILAATKKLTSYAPQGLKPWAIGQKLYNPLTDSVNPRAHTGRMFNAVLREAGYNVPNPTDYTGDTSVDTTEAGNVDPKQDKTNSGSGKTKPKAGDLVNFETSELEPEEKLGAGATSVDVDSGSPDTDAEDLWTENHNSTMVWDKVHGQWRDSEEAVIAANKKGNWDGEKVETVDASTMEDDPRLYKGEPKASKPTSMSTETGDALKILESKLAAQADAEAVNNGSVRIGPISGKSYTRNAKGIYVDASGNSPRELGYQIPTEDQVVATESANSFTLSAITPRDKVKTPPSAMVYGLEGSERERDPAFFPFYEAKRGRDMGAKYSKLPNYSTWENVSKKEKAAILKHKETTEFGASPKSVAGLIKAENELKQINKELLKVNIKASKYSKPDIYNPNEKWKKGQQKTDYLIEDSEEFFIPSVSSDIFPGGGAMSKEAQAAIGIATGKTAPPALLMELSGLEDKKNELLGNLEFAQSNVNETQTKGVYNPKATRDWGPPSVLSPSAARIANAPKTITPSSLAVNDTEPVSQGVMGDLDQEILVEGENLLETIRANEGRGVKSQGHAYFDGGDPDMEYGNYKEEGGQHLTLSGGLNIYGSMKGSSADERNTLADKIFIDNPEGKNEFLRYLNMEKRSHKDFYRTHRQRKKLMLTEEEQGRLTNYMLKDHLGKLQKHHPYLNKISEFPVAMQVFLVDTTFNMGPRWMKDKFKKFEGHLKKWATKGANPKEVRGMIKEFKDSDHYRKWGETNRLQQNIARLNSLDKAS